MPRDRILLTDWTSIDWQSLTFVGERHEISLRLTGAEAGLGADRLGAGLADAEFAIPVTSSPTSQSSAMSGKRRMARSSSASRR